VSLGEPIKLGFVPLNDCAALVVGVAKGLFAAEGLTVKLSREASWATVRDKVAAGALDAAHMLAPMPLAASLGAGSEAAAMLAPMMLALNGPAITLAPRVAEAVGSEGAAGLARLISRRRAAGASPLTFAVVFPYSAHNYLLRQWMAEAAIDPDRDVRLTVVPPPRLADMLAEGIIEGFCAGEPWNSVAVAAGVGRVIATAPALRRRTPDKVLGVMETWSQANPERLAALIRGLVQASAWAEAPENRPELAALLAQAQHVGVAAPILAGSLDGMTFHREGANRPVAEDAAWLAAEMVRWGQAGPQAEVMAAQVYAPHLYDAALA
jgi:NitT/TauT family transport system ATP-binding protein/nitrate/nitrite transport system substrate-binding protein